MVHKANKAAMEVAIICIAEELLKPQKSL